MSIQLTRITLCAVAVCLCAPALTSGQTVRAPRTDSVTIVPGPEYQAGSFREFFLGSNYRIFWTTPLRVQVLDLQSFAGGLKPLKKGGGMQTQSLRLEAEDGREYAFRTVDKLAHLPTGLHGALAKRLIADQVSSEHPAAALVAAPLLQAAGVLHATPVLVVMPHDSSLGEFSKVFAGRLGIIEEVPGKTKHGEGFAGAHEIIDSDSLRVLMDRDPLERVDARAMLKARLMDLFLNDVDRHPGQWKWARLQEGHQGPWLPIPKDRDQAFVSYHGVFLSMARLAAPNLVKFDGDVNVPGLTYNSVEMDRRMLASLERPVWDSVTAELKEKLTDAVIDSAVEMMPAEYRWSAPAFAATLKRRRDNLAKGANRFYKLIATEVDVHGTDQADRLIVNRHGDGSVTVLLEGAGGLPYFHRRFDPRETRVIRVYLHGGNDTSIVTGKVGGSIPLKIVGGNGANWLTDSSTVGGDANPSQLYDQGTVDGVNYGKDTTFNRKPWMMDRGALEPPGPDRGERIAPRIGFTSDKALGFTPHIGIDRYTYAFRDAPYASVVGIDGQYAFGLAGYRVGAHGDKRWEGTLVHLTATASASTIDLVSYHGLGNATVDSASNYFDVHQRQIIFRPAIAFQVSQTNDLSLGPVLQYMSTDNASGHFLSGTNTYGTGTFGEVGLQAGLHHEVNNRPEELHRRFVFDVSGTVFPAMWDVTTPYEVVSARAGLSITFAMPTQPTLVVRSGLKKVYGDFPFFDAAFIGGHSTLRRTDPQRYAGDAAVFATSELRVPVVKFSLMVPMQAGMLGTAEGGRVYNGSSSPGGWHSAAGGGLWIGLANQSFIVSCTFTNENGHSGPHCQTGLGF